MEIFGTKPNYVNVSSDGSTHNIHSCPSIFRTDSNHSKRPPKHPEYREYAARLDSFVAWPGRYVPQTPEKLATAGFYYIGSADRVTCFQCGITLRDWEEEHDPATEHREYSPNCPFINEPDFHQLGVSPRLACLDLETDSAAIAGAAQSSGLSVGSLGFPLSEEVAVADAVAVNDAVTDDITKAVIDMGFSTVQIQKARNMFRQIYGKDCKNVSEFVDYILDMENTVSHTEKKISQKSSSYTTSDYHNSISSTGPTSLQKGLMQSNQAMEVTNFHEPESQLSPLVAENRRLRDKKTCKVCGQQDSCILFLPCGHLVTCASCADKVADCVVCKKRILGTVRTYLT